MTITRRTAATALLATAGLAPAFRTRGQVAGPAPVHGPQRGVEEVVRLGQRPGNPAVTADGRLIFTLHPFGRPEFKLLELRGDGSLVPFPNEAASRDGFAAPLGLRAGEDGVLWILDLGAQGIPASLIGWNLARNALERRITIPDPAYRPNSFLQDFALDQSRGIAFIADATRGEPVGESRPAIVAVDLSTGRARRLLEDHPSFQAEPIDTVAEGRPLRTLGLDGQVYPFRLALDPVTIDPAYEWVYWGALTGTAIYRARAADLANPGLSADALAARVEAYREKPVCDGISVDVEGNIYITDVGRNAIGVATAEGYTVLASDPRMVWPDGLAFGPDGHLYVTVNQLNRDSAQNAGVEAGEPPYYILRIRPLAASAVGR
jgi:hypothetical protein